MAVFDTILDFLEPVDLYAISDDEGFKDKQLGKHISVNDEYFPDLEKADLVLVGFGETRGFAPSASLNEGPMQYEKNFTHCSNGTVTYIYVMWEM
jgi:hypothetical protein